MPVPSSWMELFGDGPSLTSPGRRPRRREPVVTPAARLLAAAAAVTGSVVVPG